MNGVLGMDKCPRAVWVLYWSVIVVYLRNAYI